LVRHLQRRPDHIRYLSYGAWAQRVFVRRITTSRVVVLTISLKSYKIQRRPDVLEVQWKRQWQTKEHLRNRLRKVIIRESLHLHTIHQMVYWKVCADIHRMPYQTVRKRVYAWSFDILFAGKGNVSWKSYFFSKVLCSHQAGPCPERDLVSFGKLQPSGVCYLPLWSPK